MVRAIALDPDWRVEKGSPVKGNAGNVHRYAVVAFESRVEPQAEPSDHVDDVLHRAAPAQAAIRVLADPQLPAGSRGVPVSLSLYLESSEAMFGFDISADQLAAMARLGAHFGVEVDADPEPPVS